AGLARGRARRVGAERREGCQARTYSLRRDHVEVITRSSSGAGMLRARVLIGADGSTSVIARQLLDGQTRDDDRVIAVRGYFSGVEGPSDRADLHFTSEGFRGYSWLFPIGRTRANVVLGMVRKTIPPAKEHLPKLLAQLISQDRALRDRLGSARLVGNIAGWPLTTYNGRIPIVADRV